MNMINAVWKAAQELDRINSLPVEVTGIKGEPELLPAAQRLQGHFRRIQVERDLAGMDLVSELDAAVAADIQDRIPFVREVLETSLHNGLSGHWIARHIRPDRRAGKAADHGDPQLLGV